VSTLLISLALGKTIVAPVLISDINPTSSYLSILL